MPEPALQARLDAWRTRVDAALARALPDPASSPQRLHAAMRHAVLLGGKRMRPLLVYAAGTAFGADQAALDAPAAAYGPYLQHKLLARLRTVAAQNGVKLNLEPCARATGFSSPVRPSSR